MSAIGSLFEAKTHLPQLLERVSRGERFTITRHGRPVARLVPPSVEKADVEETVRKLIGSPPSLGILAGSLEAPLH